MRRNVSLFQAIKENLPTDMLLVMMFPAILTIVSCNAHAARYCKPGVSKACGASCIPLDNKCRKSWTTSINGERPASATKYFENPKFVKTAPTSK